MMDSEANIVVNNMATATNLGLEIFDHDETNTINIDAVKNVECRQCCDLGKILGGVAIVDDLPKTLIPIILFLNNGLAVIYMKNFYLIVSNKILIGTMRRLPNELVSATLWLHHCMGHLSTQIVTQAIRNGSWINLPEEITSSIVENIFKKIDCRLACATGKRNKIPTPSGSGVLQQLIPGWTLLYDYIRPFNPPAYGGFTAIDDNLHMTVKKLTKIMHRNFSSEKVKLAHQHLHTIARHNPQTDANKVNNDKPSESDSSTPTEGIQRTLPTQGIDTMSPQSTTADTDTYPTPTIDPTDPSSTQKDPSNILQTDNGNNKRTKPFMIENKLSFMLANIKTGIVQFQHPQTADTPSNMLTKPVPPVILRISHNKDIMIQKTIKVTHLA